MPDQITLEQALIGLAGFLLLLAAGAWAQDRWRRWQDRRRQRRRLPTRRAGIDPWDWQEDARRLPWPPDPAERLLRLAERADAELSTLLTDAAVARIRATEDWHFLHGGDVPPPWSRF